MVKNRKSTNTRPVEAQELENQPASATVAGSVNTTTSTVPATTATSAATIGATTASSQAPGIMSQAPTPSTSAASSAGQHQPGVQNPQLPLSRRALWQQNGVVKQRMTSMHRQLILDSYNKRPHAAQDVNGLGSILWCSDLILGPTHDLFRPLDDHERVPVPSSVVLRTDYHTVAPIDRPFIRDPPNFWHQRPTEQYLSQFPRTRDYPADALVRFDDSDWAEYKNRITLRYQTGAFVEVDEGTGLPETKQYQFPNLETARIKDDQLGMSSDYDLERDRLWWFEETGGLAADNRHHTIDIRGVSRGCLASTAASALEFSLNRFTYDGHQRSPWEVSKSFSFSFICTCANPSSTAGSSASSVPVSSPSRLGKI